MKPKLEDMINLRKQGWPTSRIAYLYGLPEKAVDAAIRNEGQMVDYDKVARPETRHQEVLRMRREGMKIQAIADALNMPVGTVSAWLSKANKTKRSIDCQTDNESTDGMTE